MSEDQTGFVNMEEDAIDLKAIRKAIKPLLWRVLICPVQPRKKSKGGILMPDQAQDATEHLNYLGRVVSMGPLAGKSAKFENPQYANASNKANPAQYLWDVKEGDIVTYGRYSGQRMEWNGVKLLEVNDDEILAVVDSFEGFRVYAA